MTRHRLLAIAVLLLGSCAQQPRTEVIVSIDADGPVRARATALRVEVRGGPGHDPTAWGPPTVRPEPNTWPVQIGVIPLGDDTSRAFEVRAVAVGATGDLASARVTSTFAPQRTIMLPVTIEAGCEHVSCMPDEACRAGTCGAALVPPTNVDATPADFSGNYVVNVVAGPNGCMFPSWTVGMMTNGVPAMVTQMPGDGHVGVDIGGTYGLYLDLVEHTHHFDGVVVGNHLSATLVGGNSSSAMGCTYTFNARLTLDLAGANVTGSIEAYAVAPDIAACASVLGCSTSESITGARM